MYFHRHSVVDDAFGSLSVKDPVELVAVYGESKKGPQASTVRPIGSLKFVK